MPKENLATFLVHHLDNKSYNCLKWFNKERRTFSIDSPHKTANPKKDDDSQFLFDEWNKNKGRIGLQKNSAKGTFRSALNSQKNIQTMKDLSNKDKKFYQFLSDNTCLKRPDQAHIYSFIVHFFMDWMKRCANGTSLLIDDDIKKLEEEGNKLATLFPIEKEKPGQSTEDKLSFMLKKTMENLQGSYSDERMVKYDESILLGFKNWLCDWWVDSMFQRNKRPYMEIVNKEGSFRKKRPKKNMNTNTVPVDDPSRSSPDSKTVVDTGDPQEAKYSILCQDDKKLFTDFGGNEEMSSNEAGSTSTHETLGTNPNSIEELFQSMFNKNRDGGGQRTNEQMLSNEAGSTILTSEEMEILYDINEWIDFENPLPESKASITP